MRMTGALILFAAACVPPCAVADDSLGRVFGAIGWTAAAAAAAGYLWGPERSRLAAGDDLRAEDQDGAEDQAAAKGAYASPAASPQPASAPAPADQVQDKDLKACDHFCRQDAPERMNRGELLWVQENCLLFCAGDLEFAIGDRVQSSELGDWSRLGTVIGIDSNEPKGKLHFRVMLDWGQFPQAIDSRHLEKLENPAPKPEAEPEALKVKFELSFDRGNVWKYATMILVSTCTGTVLLTVLLLVAFGKAIEINEKASKP